MELFAIRLASDGKSTATVNLPLMLERVSQGDIMAFCPICGRSHDPDIGCSDATGQAIRDMGLPRAVRRHANSTSTGGRHFKRVSIWILAIGGISLLILWLFRGVS